MGEGQLTEEEKGTLPDGKQLEREGSKGRLPVEVGRIGDARGWVGGVVYD